MIVLSLIIYEIIENQIKCEQFYLKMKEEEENGTSIENFDSILLIFIPDY